MVTTDGSRQAARCSISRFAGGGIRGETPAAQAQRLFAAAGAIQNTMVLVARAAALFDLYSTHLPHLA